MTCVWESTYFDAYDRVLLNSDIYLAVRDLHVESMDGCDVVLDSGCGTGNVTIELLGRGHVVHAVDMSEKALDILGKRCAKLGQRPRVHRLSAEHLPFEDKTFDGITSMFVAHFVDDLQGYLEEHYRVLRRGGVFVLTGRTSGKNMEKVVDSYEASLRKRGLLPRLAPEMEMMRKGIRDSVSNIVKNGLSAEAMTKLLKRIGFTGIEERPNPYFGQCYSLVARRP